MNQKNWTIRDGLIYDGSGSAPFRGDVEVRDGIITDVVTQRGGTEINTPDDTNVFDAAGYIVTPGLIDLHVHVYDGMNMHSLAPSDAGLKTGVTTLLDMGSAGAMNYGTFHKYVIPKAQESVFTLLNISQFGVQGHPEILPYIGDLHDSLHFDVSSAVRCIEAHRGEILGVKVRLTAALADNDGTKERAAFHAALAVRNQTRLPLYVHHVMSSIPLEEVLAALQQGDVLTHFYHDMGDGGFTGKHGAPGEALQDARERGVFFDVGHGSGCFMWRVAETACLEHNFWPDTISTDIHIFNVETPVVDLPTTMSKFLHLGMPIEAIVQSTALTPALIMGQQNEYGLLSPGRNADITVLQQIAGTHELVDSAGEVRTANQRLVPVCVFKNGRQFDCQTSYMRADITP